MKSSRSLAIANGVSSAIVFLKRLFCNVNVVHHFNQPVLATWLRHKKKCLGRRFASPLRELMDYTKTHQKRLESNYSITVYPRESIGPLWHGLFTFASLSPIPIHPTPLEWSLHIPVDGRNVQWSPSLSLRSIWIGQLLQQALRLARRRRWERPAAKKDEKGGSKGLGVCSSSEDELNGPQSAVSSVAMFVDLGRKCLQRNPLLRRHLRLCTVAENPTTLHLERIGREVKNAASEVLLAVALLCSIEQVNCQVLPGKDKNTQRNGAKSRTGNR